MPALRIVGPGRAGTSLARALERRAWHVTGFVGRGDRVVDAAAGVDLCVIATPDAAVAATAAAIAPSSGGNAVIAHLSGTLGLDVLAPHTRRASLHPLVSLPDAERGADALAGGAWFAVAGDPLVRAVVADLGGRLVEVAEERRAAYHAAACIASNHLVALLAQVERVASTAGVPLDAYLALIRGTLENVASCGAAAALTGPSSRGDWRTLETHLAALDPVERPLYLAAAEAAAALAGRTLPRSFDTGLGVGRGTGVASCS